MAQFIRTVAECVSGVNKGKPGPYRFRTAIAANIWMGRGVSTFARSVLVLLGFVGALYLDWTLLSQPLTLIEGMPPDAAIDCRDISSATGVLAQPRRARSPLSLPPANRSHQILIGWVFAVAAFLATVIAVAFLTGVMTSRSNLLTRIGPLIRTWGRPNRHAKVVVFTGRYSDLSAGAIKQLVGLADFEFVCLAGVDDSYPPQRKSFAMLSYMYDNYLDDFDWFVRADDDVFIKVEQLSAMLSSIDAERPVLLGQAGVGKPHELGKLALNETDNFCMGGPSVIISQRALALVGPHLQSCFANNLLTFHEDVELSRCFRQHVGIQCTWAYDLQSMFYQNFLESNGSFEKKLHWSSYEARRALSLHPFKNATHLYAAEMLLAALAMERLRQRRAALLELIAQSDVGDTSGAPDTLRLPRTAPVVSSWLLPTLRQLPLHVPEQSSAPFRPLPLLMFSNHLTARHLLPAHVPPVFTFFQRTQSVLYDDNPLKGFTNTHKDSLERLVTSFVADMNRDASYRGRTVEFKDVYYGYYGVNAFSGVDYVLDLILTYKREVGRTFSLPVRRHASLHAGFTAMYVRSVNSETTKRPKEPVYFVVPLSGRLERLREFLLNFVHECMAADALVAPVGGVGADSCSLVVVHFGRGARPVVQAVVDQLPLDAAAYTSPLADSWTAGGGRIWLLEEPDLPFSRSDALNRGAQFLHQLSSASSDEDRLLFFIDVDIHFTTDVIDQVRQNTIRGQQVYVPVVFSQYSPLAPTGGIARQSLLDVGDDAGYWRSFGFGIVSIYKSDFLSIGGFGGNIKGWGLEDVQLYEQVVGSGRLQVFRAASPHLVHRYHEVVCAEDLPQAQHNMCLGSKHSTLASVRTLGRLYLLQPNRTASLDVNALARPPA